MPARRGPERVTGPYEHRGKFRFLIIGADGRRQFSPVFPTAAEARTMMGRAVAQLVATSSTTIHEAIAEYRLYLIHTKENKEKAWKETLRRLHLFFHDQTEIVARLSEQRCADLYEALRTRPIRNSRKSCAVVGDHLPRRIRQSEANADCTCKVLANDSHRNILLEVKTFLRWCVGQKYIAGGESPMDAVAGVGRRRKHGKKQLRVDEARSWMAAAFRLANEGEEGAVGALIALLMNLRATEIILRCCRDVDDGGRLLWVEAAEGEDAERDEGLKTVASRRTLEIPAELRPYMLQLKQQGRDGESLLWSRGHERGWVNDWVGRICRAAKVPVVTAHGMRGLHATLNNLGGGCGVMAGIQASMGHEHLSTTIGYMDPSGLANAAARRARRRLLMDLVPADAAQGGGE